MTQAFSEKKEQIIIKTLLGLLRDKYAMIMLILHVGLESRFCCPCISRLFSINSRVI